MGPWRLGVVEHVDEHGVRVRAYVAPTGAYAGSAGTYPAEYLEVVPIETARAYLAGQVQLVEQLGAAIDAATRARGGG